MAEVVVMPKLGFNMDEGQLVKWHKKEGEQIKKGEILFEILTDKTTMEIESTTDGFVRKLFVEEGEKVPVTLPIAIIGEKDEDISKLIEKAKEQLGKSEKSQEEVDEDQQAKLEEKKESESVNKVIDKTLKLTPRAKKYLDNYDIDVELLDIKGTGYEGGITKRDIRKYLEEHKVKITPIAKKIAEAENVDLREVKGTGIHGRIVKADVESRIEKQETEYTFKSQVQPTKQILKDLPYTGARRVIGERMSESKYTAPHVYFTIPVDLSKLLELRKQINESREAELTITDFISAAVVKALEKHPHMNSSLINDKIVQYKSINIGIAVGLEDGLIVPVIKNAQCKKITEISSETKVLVEKARAGKLMPEEYQGGTFTISNLGMFGVEEFTAIINQPETGILAVGAAIDSPVVTIQNGEKKIDIKPIMKITLSVDHRVIDGMQAAKFIKCIKDILENPINILI
jgi:pyruvate dehydrogenase E2 component (dihydrolipoamide acetyltransferase)